MAAACGVAPADCCLEAPDVAATAAAAGVALGVMVTRYLAVL
jgi:hypothetical protein